MLLCKTMQLQNLLLLNQVRADDFTAGIIKAIKNTKEFAEIKLKYPTGRAWPVHLGQF